MTSARTQQPSAANYFEGELEGIRVFLLNRAALAASDFDTLMELGMKSDEIANRHLMRNGLGRQAEDEGDVDAAIAYHERNVAEMTGGSLPYERLRIIYRRRKQYDDAIRVCQRFVEMADRLIEMGSPRSNLQKKRQHFQDWIEKMTVQLTRT